MNYKYMFFFLLSKGVSKRELKEGLKGSERTKSKLMHKIL